LALGDLAKGGAMAKAKAKNAAKKPEIRLYN
jgi:hypothetical protein